MPCKLCNRLLWLGERDICWICWKPVSDWFLKYVSKEK